jgi:hypothetical protein
VIASFHTSCEADMLAECQELLSQTYHCLTGVSLMAACSSVVMTPVSLPYPLPTHLV